MVMKVGANYNPADDRTPAQRTRDWWSQHPDARVWRYYFDGDEPVRWDLPDLAEVPDRATFIISFKMARDIDRLPAIAGAYPQRRYDAAGPFLISYHHEPDSWKSPTETAGDPDPQTWRERCRQLLDVAYLMDPELRRRVLLGPIFTEYAMRNRPGWQENWGVVLDWPGWNYVGWDVHNISGSRYRTATEKFGPALIRSALAKLPVAWCEVGEPRKADPDAAELESGAVRSARLRSYYDYNRGRPEVLAYSWYWRDNNDLDLTTREHAEMARIQRDAAARLPDPTHPQYQMGYGAGARVGEQGGRRAAYTDVRLYVEERLAPVTDTGSSATP